MKFTFDSHVRYSEVGENNQLTLGSVINYFQDCSTFHSEQVGVGVNFLREEKKIWVLSAWQIVIERYPEFYEKIRIATWPYAFKRFLGSRNFTMEDEEGQVIAYANSIWTYLDGVTGFPCNVSEKELKAYTMEEKYPMEYAPRKIAVPEHMKEESSFTVQSHHLDTNHHVNNGQYVIMAQEYVPEGFQIHEVRVEYKGQAVLGDRIVPKVRTEEGICTVALCNAEGKPYAVVELKEKNK